MTISKYVPHRILIVACATLISATLLGACSSSADTSELESQLSDLNTKLETVTADLATLREEFSEVQVLITPATPVPPTEYREHGFTLPVPDGVELQVAGIGGGEASDESGQLTASAGGVTMVLIWTSAGLAPGVAVQGAFEVLQASAALDFRALNEGDIEVDGESGVFGAFAAEDGDTVLGIGLIGGWTCGEAPTYSITVIGADPDSVQGSFEGFTNGFKCSS